MESIKTISPGSKVRIGGETPGVVIGVAIRAIGVTGYEVAWWSGNSRTTAWVEPHELEPAGDDAKPLRVGFEG